MSWSGLSTETALERDVLERCLPLAATSNTGSQRATIDMASDSVNTALSFNDIMGATPGGCVDLLGIRPLLAGTAWKVLDLLLETAFDLARLPRDAASGRWWSIDRKLRHARANVGRPPALSQLVWQALTTTYVETADLRHSLVHRAVYTDPSGALIGEDSAGNPLPPLSAEEQEAFGRVALRAVQVLTAPHPDPRVQADLIRQLGHLAQLHNIRLPPVGLDDSLPEITVIVDPDPNTPGNYLLDVPRLRARQPFSAVTHADLIIQFRDQPGRELRGRLEEAPNGVESISTATPPHWLSR